jgi:hypothetical protein
MNPWPRRLAYLTITLIWLLLISLPAFAFFLAARGQIQIGAQDGRHTRVFLLQERDLQGLGVEQTRPLRGEPTCLRTTIRYYLWEGEGENTAFCRCTDPVTGATLPVDPRICPPP